MRKLAMLLIIVVVGGGLAATALFVQRGDQTLRSAPGVQLADASGGQPIDMGELTDVEMQAELAKLAAKWRQPAVEPSIDPVNKGVIPGICGVELDQSATYSELMQAERDSVIDPVLQPTYPKSVWDYGAYPIYQGNPAKKQIALVINVAWGNENLPQMLDTLSREQVKASFFLVGRWVAQNEQLVRQIAAGGHEFGNHAYSDPHLPKLSKEGIAQEITRTSQAIEQITGTPVRFFSPPYNDFNQTVLDTAAELGYLTVICSLDTADWLRPGVDRIVRRIVPKAHNGAIVLMHPTEQTPAALEQIINGLQAKGYQLVTVSELLAPAAGTTEIPR